MIVIYAFSIVCRNVMGNLTNQDFDGPVTQSGLKPATDAQ